MDKGNKIYLNLLNKLSKVEANVHELDARTVVLEGIDDELDLVKELHFIRTWLTELKEETDNIKLRISIHIKKSVINNHQTNLVLNIEENSLIRNRINKMERSVSMLKYRIYKLLSLAS